MRILWLIIRFPRGAEISVGIFLIRVIHQFAGHLGRGQGEVRGWGNIQIRQGPCQEVAGAGRGNGASVMRDRLVRIVNHKYDHNAGILVGAPATKLLLK